MGDSTKPCMEGSTTAAQAGAHRLVVEQQCTLSPICERRICQPAAGATASARLGGCLLYADRTSWTHARAGDLLAAGWGWQSQRNSPEMRLTEPATMTTPNT